MERAPRFDLRPGYNENPRELVDIAASISLIGCHGEGLLFHRHLRFHTRSALTLISIALARNRLAHRNPDTPSAFGWDAVNVVVQGLVELEERPNPVKLTKYIEGGIEPVLEGSLRRFYDNTLGG